jgi:hypothetical protein
MRTDHGKVFIALAAMADSPTPNRIPWLSRGYAKEGGIRDKEGFYAVSSVDPLSVQREV